MSRVASGHQIWATRGNMLRHLPWNAAAPAPTGASSKGSALTASGERAMRLSPDASRTARQQQHQGRLTGGRQSGPTSTVREVVRIQSAVVSSSASFPRRRVRMAAVACCCFLPVLGFGAASRTHWAAAAAADVQRSATLPKVALLRGSGWAASGDQKRRHVGATARTRRAVIPGPQGRGALVSGRPPQPIPPGSDKPQEQPLRLRGRHHSASLRGISRSTGSSSSPPLHDLLPDDLDELRSDAVIAAVGVQLLLFGGFVPGPRGWTKDPTDPPLDLKQRLERITPTWKPGGAVDYSWVDDSDHDSIRAPQLPAPHITAKAPLSLFGAARSPPTAIRAGATVASMCRALEDIGLSSDDFADAPSRKALREMLRWRIDDSGLRKDGGIISAAPMNNPSGSASGNNNIVTLLVLSFDATPSCRGLDDCPLPGPSNELLAATAAAFAASKDERERRHGASTVKVVAQWEVAAAIGALRRHQRRPDINVTAIGTPGLFENTAQILEMMRDHVCGQRVLLLAHPDHLPRVLRTAKTVLGGNWSSSTDGDAAAAAGACSNEGPLELLPAMLPYSLDWPSALFPAEKLDLYESVEAVVHSQGGTTLASWYSDPRAGFFPDGDPQRWAHRREVWVLYDHWARAKGLATGVIRADADAGAAEGRPLKDLR